MSTAIKDRAKPVLDTANQFISTITTKPPTRRQKFMRKLRKFGIPVLILSGAGALAGIARRKDQQSDSN